MTLFQKSFVFLICGALAVGCTNRGGSFSDTDDETSQQLGDTMASIDEFGGTSGGGIALQQSFEKTMHRISPSEFKTPFWKNLFVSNAFAASCLASSTFNACASNTITREFDDCTGPFGGIWNGAITLSWGGTSANCQMQAEEDFLVREPNFAVTGFRGAELVVTKSGTFGQKLTWVSGSGDSRVFEFENDGIHRVFSTPSGAALFDFTTKTTSPITVTGALRSNRVVDGGVLRTTNNLNDVTCDFVPSDVTWDSTCTCAVSGAWSATCSDDTSYEVEITGCGTADVTRNDVTRSVEFDRCLEN
jgi:hypothetical protein